MSFTHSLVIFMCFARSTAEYFSLSVTKHHACACRGRETGAGRRNRSGCRYILRSL